MIPLNAEIRGMWNDYVSALSNMDRDINTPEELAIFERNMRDRLERLMNVLEIAAAIEVEGTLSGVSRILMSDYLRRVLDDIISDAYTNSKVSELLQDDETYLYIRRFLKINRPLSVALPPQWYANPPSSWPDRARNLFRL